MADYITHIYIYCKVMKIVMIGPVSYVGGVSVHIHRLSKLLKQNLNDFYIELIDESPLQHTKRGQINVRRITDFLKCIRIIKSADIVHIHSVHWIIRIYNIFFASFILDKTVVVTLHSFRINGYKLNVTNFFLKNAKAIIVVSKEIEVFLGSKKTPIFLKEAFIPPIESDEPELPVEISSRLSEMSLTKTIICANAFRLTPFNNSELYGIDQCINIAQKAKEENLPVMIVFVIGTIRKNDELYLKYRMSIENEKLSDYFWIIPYQISFINLIKQSSIVLRPTLSDGDALTLREGLFLKKCVIASDVVIRPQGTITYKTGDSDDLFLTLKVALNKLQNRVGDENENQRGNTLEYYNFYNSIYLACFN